MRSKLFFPNAAGASVASSFFTIFAGFLARPIDALIFGGISAIGLGARPHFLSRCC